MRQTRAIATVVSGKLMGRYWSDDVFNPGCGGLAGRGELDAVMITLALDAGRLELWRVRVDTRSSCWGVVNTNNHPLH